MTAPLQALAECEQDVRAMPGRVAAIRGRPTRMATDSFAAWLANGTPVDVSSATTLDEAVDLAAPHSAHKGNFVIQHTRRDARRFLHFYGVTKSTKNGSWRHSCVSHVRFSATGAASWTDVITGPRP